MSDTAELKGIILAGGGGVEAASDYSRRQQPTVADLRDMRFIDTEIPGVLIIERDVFRDARGFQGLHVPITKTPR